MPLEKSLAKLQYWLLVTKTEELLVNKRNRRRRTRRRDALAR
jgi:hypothetical protein